MAHRLLIVLTAAVLATLTLLPAPAQADADNCVLKCWEQYHGCIQNAARQGFLGIFHRIRDCDRQLEACKTRCHSDGPIRPGTDGAVGVDLAADNDGEPPPQPSTAGTRCVDLPAQNGEPQHHVGCWPIPAREARR